MSKEHLVLAIITARGGSKGLPRKNLLTVGGKPLLAWTIIAALEADTIDKVVLSSDDDEIIETARAWGCEVPFIRPPELASDTATSIDVVFHALKQIQGFEYVVLLQPTSPLRTGQDIDEAFTLMKMQDAPSCAAVCEAEQSPYWMYYLTDEARLCNFLPMASGLTRRQDLPPAYVLNGAIYIARVDWLLKTKSFVAEGCIAYIMSKKKSIDIDTADDFEIFKKNVLDSNC